MSKTIISAASPSKAMNAIHAVVTHGLPSSMEVVATKEVAMGIEYELMGKGGANVLERYRMDYPNADFSIGQITVPCDSITSLESHANAMARLADVCHEGDCVILTGGILDSYLLANAGPRIAFYRLIVSGEFDENPAFLYPTPISCIIRRHDSNGWLDCRDASLWLGLLRGSSG